jgi:hypothetical protein
LDLRLKGGQVEKFEIFKINLSPFAHYVHLGKAPYPKRERFTHTLISYFPYELSTSQLNPTAATMGRLHSNGKGISASAIPYSRTPPAWLKTTPDQVVDQICKLAKKGATPSQIGVVLRDSHGIAQVKVVTGEFEYIHAILRRFRRKY